MAVSASPVFVVLGSALLVSACEPDPAESLLAAPTPNVSIERVPVPDAGPFFTFTPGMEPVAPPPARPHPACLSEDAGAHDARLVDGGASVTQTAAVVRGLRRALASCFNKALAEDPLAEGCVTMVVQVAPDGSVTSAKATDVDGLPPVVTDCVSSVIHGARFDPPGPKGATIEIPAKFMRGYWPRSKP